MLANDEDWKLTPIIGIFIHLLAFAPEITVPWLAVYTSNIRPKGRSRIEIHLKFLNGIFCIDNIKIKPNNSITKCLNK